MKVKELIRELKKMPQDLEVGMAAQDNYEYEVADMVRTVDATEQRDFETGKFVRDCVILHG